MNPSKIKPLEERDKQMGFEELLINISTLFISLPADQIDSKIEEAQHQICKFLDIDRSTLWQLCEQEPGTMLLTHIYQPPDLLKPFERLNLNDFWPWTLKKMMAGETVTVSKMTDLPAEAARDRESFALYGAKSGVYVPLSVGQGPVFGVLTFAVVRRERDWSNSVVKGFTLLAQVFSNALARKNMEEQLEQRLREIEGLKLQLEQENIYLQKEVKILSRHSGILGKSTAIKNILAQAEQVAGTDSTVLILGETGTGKELLARAIHSMSLRQDRPLVTINCASLPPSLIENELFGREKGAYTGAMTKMIGRFELADRSTLFLDEIGELPFDLQSKLLRVLEEGTIERLGSTKSLHINVRIIAATNRDIEKEVEKGKFRQDLFYRLNVFPILIPPLRERTEDIPLMVRAFVREFNERLGSKFETVPDNKMASLESYTWPGNVRELRNVIERAMILSKDETLDVEPPKKVASEEDAIGSLDDIMRREILTVLNKTDWRISGPGGAAEALQLKRTTLQSKIKKLGIKRPPRQ